MMKALQVFEKSMSTVSRFAGCLSYAGYILMIVLTTADVILRKTINQPILGSYEIVQYLLLVSVFASFAYCQVMHGHIQVKVILNMLPRRVVFVLYTITGLLSFVIFLFIGYAASQQALYAGALGYASDVLKFPIAPFMWLECICMIIFSLTCLVDVFYSAAAVFDEKLRDKLWAEWG